MHSTTTKVIKITMCVRFDCDYELYDYDEKLTCLFFARVESRRIEAGMHDAS